MLRKTMFALAALSAIVFSFAGVTGDASAKRVHGWKGGGYKIHVIHRGYRFHRPRHFIRWHVGHRWHHYRHYRHYGFRGHYRFGSYRYTMKRSSYWRCIALQKRGYRIYCG